MSGSEFRDRQKAVDLALMVDVGDIGVPAQNAAPLVAVIKQSMVEQNRRKRPAEVNTWRAG